MSGSEQFQQRIVELGREIFELAQAARPRVWQSAWWLEQTTRAMDHDAHLRTRAFQFVDCLPALQSNEAISRHLGEYLDAPGVEVPTVVRAALRPGRLQRMREELVGRAAYLGATRMAGRFITGFDAPSAIKTIERLRSQGMAFTLDVLGESTTSYAQADRYAKVYHDLLDHLTPLAARWPTIPIIDADSRGPMPRVNVSLKLTGLDPHFDAIDPARAIRRVGERLRPLLRHARQAGAFANIDMESNKHHDLTLELFKQMLMED